jgi:cytochrome c oxidase subunit II
MAGGTIPALLVLGVMARPAATPSATPDRVEITVSAQGFRPDRLTLRKGEPVRLSLTSSDGEHCFALDAFRIEKRVLAGKPSLVDLTPDRTGTFPYHDCLAEAGAPAGRLMVVE